MQWILSTANHNAQGAKGRAHCRIIVLPGGDFVKGAGKVFLRMKWWEGVVDHREEARRP